MDMMLNHLMERLQTWGFGEWAVRLHCHYSLLVHFRVLFMGQIELFYLLPVICLYTFKLWLLYNNTWNHLTACKKNDNVFTNQMYVIDIRGIYYNISIIIIFPLLTKVKFLCLALNNLQWLIYHKTNEYPG